MDPMDPSHASWIASSSGVVGFPPSRTNGNVCSPHLESESKTLQELKNSAFRSLLEQCPYANHHSWNLFPPPKKNDRIPLRSRTILASGSLPKPEWTAIVERRKDMPILCKHTGPQPVMDQRAKRIQKATPCVIPYCPFVTKFLRISEKGFEKGELQINFKKSWCP